MLYADDARIVSRSPAGLARMMAVIVEIFRAFGLTVSEKKTETLLMRALNKAQQSGETSTPLLPALQNAAVVSVVANKPNAKTFVNTSSAY